MIQRFIELGKGYSDIYELIEIAKRNDDRLKHMMVLHTTINDKAMSSLIVILNPPAEGKFQPIYICREGVPNHTIKPNKRFQLFADTAKELNKELIQFNVKPSTLFSEKDLYFQHLIAIFRLNHYLPALT